MAARKAVNTTRQGAAFELQIMEHLRDRGYTVLRSSGSKGAVDVVAVGDPHTLWIQAKITNPVIPPAERRAVIDLVDRINLAGAVALPLVAYRSGGRVHFRELTGPGASEWESFEPTTHRQALCSCGHRRDAHSMDTGCWTGSLGECPGCVCRTFEFPADAKRRLRAAGRKSEK
jgi:Holliday junction resolvase